MRRANIAYIDEKLNEYATTRVDTRVGWASIGLHFHSSFFLKSCRVYCTTRGDANPMSPDNSRLKTAVHACADNRYLFTLSAAVRYSQNIIYMYWRG